MQNMPFKSVCRICKIICKKICIICKQYAGFPDFAQNYMQYAKYAK